jgi:hypothetical protein
MSITFTCTCGKRMRVRDEMAARRFMCPACGCPVGIPSGKPTQRGTPVGPLSPAERRRQPRVVAAEPPAVVVPFLNDPLRENTAPPAGFPRSGWGTLGYRAVEVSDDGTPAPAPAPRPVQPPVLEPPSYRVVQVADEVVEQDRRRRIDDAQEISFRSRYHRVRRRSRRERPRQLERHWYECLAFPFLTWKWLLGLAVLLAIVTSAGMAWVAEGVVGLTPDVGFFDDPRSDLLFKWLFRAAFAGAVVGFTFSYLHWVLSAAAAGEVPHGSWPVFDVRLWLRGSGLFLAALLAGPVELAVLGFYYWMECGDPSALDWIILVEIGIAAVGCGLFALAAMTCGRPTEFNPLRALELAHRLGGRGAALVLFSAGAVLVHGWVALAAMEKMHSPRGGFGGWLLLVCCWLSGLFVASFVLRVLGRWCAEENQKEQALLLEEP